MVLGDGPLLAPLQSRAAHRAEQRLVRQLARELGLESPEGREKLHDLLEFARTEGIQGYRALRDFIQDHLP